MKKPLQIFKPGTHVAQNGNSYTYTAADMAELAASYSAASYCAPLVVGHPKIDAPAYGWAESLSVNSDGVLEAKPKDVDPAFADLVNAGRFRTISVSVWPREHSSNPTPGKLHLRHVGFLGAAAPAVKGLKCAEFAGDSECVEFSVPLENTVSNVLWTLQNFMRGFRDWFIADKGLEEADKVVPDYLVSGIESQRATIDAQLQAQYAELEQGKQKLIEIQTALDGAEALRAEKAARIEQDFADSTALEAFAQAGKLLPREVPIVLGLLKALRSTPSDFADMPDAVAPRDALIALVAERVVQVQFSEASPSAQAADLPTFAAPDGYQVDPAQLRVFQRAQAHQKANPGVGFDAAIKATTEV